MGRIRWLLGGAARSDQHPVTHGRVLGRAERRSRGGAVRAATLFGITLLAGALVAGCEKGPAQKAGEKVDRALDRLTGKGPAEKAGERLDKAVDELKK
jgi:hypothetical protein